MYNKVPCSATSKKDARNYTNKMYCFVFYLVTLGTMYSVQWILFILSTIFIDNFASPHVWEFHILEVGEKPWHFVFPRHVVLIFHMCQRAMILAGRCSRREYPVGVGPNSKALGPSLLFATRDKSLRSSLDKVRLGIFSLGRNTLHPIWF